MNLDQTISRRRFLLAGGGAALLGLGGGATAALSGGARAATTHAMTWDSEPYSQLRDIAYCIVLENGNWVGPRTSDGSIDPTLVDELVLAARRGHAPRYLRFTEPNGHIGHEVPVAGSTEYVLTRRLVDAGLKLGVAINVLLEGDKMGGCEAPQPSTGPHKPARCVRTLASVFEQAETIKRDSDAHGGIYDWIFLDFAWDRTPAGPYGLNDLQQMVDELARIGWSRVMINASGFGPKHFVNMPQRTWAIAHRFQLFVGANWATAARTAASSHLGSLQTPDRQFVDFVTRHRPGCRAILKLEDPSETQRFGALPRAEQQTLLALWAQQGDRLRYRMIYPIFVDGDKPLGNVHNDYDSLTAGTFATQLQLMRRYG